MNSVKRHLEKIKNATFYSVQHLHLPSSFVVVYLNMTEQSSEDERNKIKVFKILSFNSLGKGTTFMADFKDLALAKGGNR